MPERGPQFRMQTNIGPQEGSQGTLFQGGYPKNWPRGYTPERLRAVTESTNWLDPQRTYKPRAEAVAKLRDTVARSTVPVEHLTGVYFTPTLDPTTDRVEGGTRGLYKGEGKTALSGGLVKVHPDETQSMTPIHEIGHHVSLAIEKTEHSAYDTPERRGTEEGYAENYAETHFRDPRGKQRASQNVAHSWASGDYEQRHGNPRQFTDAFNAKRAASPLRQQQAAARRAQDHEMMHPAPTGYEGQLPLLDKLTHSEGAIFKDWHSWDYTHEDRQRGLKRGQD